MREMRDSLVVFCEWNGHVRSLSIDSLLLLDSSSGGLILLLLGGGDGSSLRLGGGRSSVGLALELGLCDDLLGLGNLLLGDAVL